MKIQRLLALLLALVMLQLSSCTSRSTATKSPYFGIHDRNKRFVPPELHEKEPD